MADHPHTIDRWDDATGESLIEPIAGVSDYLVALETYRAAVTANSPVLAVISVLPSGELGSGCELAHPGRPRCDGHHRMGEFPAFARPCRLTAPSPLRPASAARFSCMV